MNESSQKEQYQTDATSLHDLLKSPPDNLEILQDDGKITIILSHSKDVKMVLGIFMLLFGGIVCLLLYIGSDKCSSSYERISKYHHVRPSFHTCTDDEHMMLYVGFGLVFFIGLILFIGGLFRLYAKTFVTIDNEHIQVQYKQRFRDTTPKTFDKKTLHLSTVDKLPDGTSSYGTLLKMHDNSNNYYICAGLSEEKTQWLEKVLAASIAEVNHTVSNTTD